VWLSGNASEDWTPATRKLFDSEFSCVNVGVGPCVVSITHVAITALEHEMAYLSHAVNQHPMLRVSGQILLAFGCATPLVLLLCFLV
jgi:hypothetical protein